MYGARVTRWAHKNARSISWGSPVWVVHIIEGTVVIIIDILGDNEENEVLIESGSDEQISEPGDFAEVTLDPVTSLYDVPTREHRIPYV